MKRGGRIFVVAVLALTTVAYAKQKERAWQTGKLVGTDEARYFAGTVGSSNTTGEIYDSTYSGDTSSSQTAVYRVYQTYIIEANRYVYVAKERLRWRWSKPANLTVNGPVKYAVEKRNLFLLDEDGKEDEATISKKVLKATP